MEEQGKKKKKKLLVRSRWMTPYMHEGAPNTQWPKSPDSFFSFKTRVGTISLESFRDLFLLFFMFYLFIFFFALPPGDSFLRRQCTAWMDMNRGTLLFF